MRHQAMSTPPVRHAMLALLASVALSAGAAHASTSQPAAVATPSATDGSAALPPMVPPAGGAASSPWWMGFNDATLNLLVRDADRRQAGLRAVQLGDAAPDADTARAAADDVKREVVANYVGARVLSVRWLALNGLRDASQRQRQLLTDAQPDPKAPAPDVQATLASLQQRSEHAARQQQAIALQRESLLQNLASLCGLPPAELVDLLAPVLTQATVPAFSSAVPGRLPKSILRARPDVAAAEAAVLRSLRSAGGRQHEVVAQMQQAEGWIDVDGDPAAAVADGKPAVAVPPSTALATPELDELHTLLDHAAHEVADDLRTLNERARLQAERAQLADSSRQAFLAAREQLNAGKLNELQLLEQYQRLLAESDRYAAACGELAMAWLQLVASTGASEQVLVR